MLTYSGLTFVASTMSLMNFCLISMCFVGLLLMGFFASLIVPWLSSLIATEYGSVVGSTNACTYRRKTTSLTTSSSATYPDSEVERAVTCYVRECQEIPPPAAITAPAETERLLLMQVP